MTAGANDFAVDGWQLVDGEVGAKHFVANPAQVAVHRSFLRVLGEAHSSFLIYIIYRQSGLMSIV